MSKDRTLLKSPNYSLTKSLCLKLSTSILSIMVIPQFISWSLVPCSQLKVASFESYITKAVALTHQNCTTFVIRTRVKMEVPAFALDLIKENVLAWSNTVELTASVSIRQDPNYENEFFNNDDDRRDITWHLRSFSSSLPSSSSSSSLTSTAYHHYHHYGRRKFASLRN